MGQNELELELASGLTASSTARAAVTREFSGSATAEQLMDLRVAVASLINGSIRSHDPGPIRLRVWSQEGLIRGQVTDNGGGASDLRQRRRLGSVGLNVLNAVTREWGTEGNTAWFTGLVRVEHALAMAGEGRASG